MQDSFKVQHKPQKLLQGLDQFFKGILSLIETLIDYSKGFLKIMQYRELSRTLLKNIGRYPLKYDHGLSQMNFKILIFIL